MWMKSRDRLSKYFFSSIKECSAGGLIMELYNEDDMFVSLRAQKVLKALLMEEELTNAV